MHVIMDVYDIKDIQDGSQWISMVLYDHALHDESWWLDECLPA